MRLCYPRYNTEMDIKRYYMRRHQLIVVGVAFGAFGAHGIRSRVSDERILKAYETGAHYHLFHSVALILCSFVKSPLSNVAGLLFLTGNFLFSGSLYAYGITQGEFCTSISSDCSL